MSSTISPETKTGNCQLHKDFVDIPSTKSEKREHLNLRLIMVMVVCQLAVRRRIQGRDTVPYTLAQKGPTIIALVMCIFRSQNHSPSQPETQMTTS